jgi:hypothetical protein
MEIAQTKEYIKSTFYAIVSEADRIVSEQVVISYVYERLSDLFDSPTLTDPKYGETYDYKWNLWQIMEREVRPALKLMKTTQDSYKDYNEDAQMELLEKATEMATK